jgi:putative PIN family toxin of toxin-antitoxin system
MQEGKLRLVIDTNIWISYLLGSDFTEFDSVLQSKPVVLLFSEELLSEFLEVAQRPKFKKYFGVEDLTALIASMEDFTEWVTIRSIIRTCRDPKDDFLLALALDGKATHLITGDKDLLALHPFHDVNIIRMTEFLVGAR